MFKMKNVEGLRLFSKCSGFKSILIYNGIHDYQTSYNRAYLGTGFLYLFHIVHMTSESY
jgi:hypothetical protein